MKQQFMVLTVCSWLAVVLSTPVPTHQVGVIIQAFVTTMALFTLVNYLKKTT